MTRINLVPPSELMDQHLFAEFREIKMVPKSLRRSLEAAHKRAHKGKAYPIAPAEPYSQNVLRDVWSHIPKAYTLNTGHVSFFYDKGVYLFRRYEALRIELNKRGIKFNKEALLDPDNIFMSLDHNFNNDYTPTAEALAIVRQRIAEKIAIKPNWYRYSGETKCP